MIRKILFTVTLLVPGLAYGGNPSADLSVQVIPAGTAGTCGTIAGQAATDAATAGFTTCALYNDFTTAIPNTVGTGLPSNWLNCNSPTDTGAVWNPISGVTAPCPGAYRQLADPTYGNLALDLDYKSSYMVQGNGNDNMLWLNTVPWGNGFGGAGTSTNIPAHSWSNAYYEITYRATSDMGPFPGEKQAFWSWTCCGTGDTFVEQDFTEDWATGGRAIDVAWDWWNNGSFGGYSNGRGYPAITQSAYNTFGVLVTGNNSNFAVCTYLNGSRISCNGIQNYLSGQNGAQRRSVIFHTGVECNQNFSDVSCAVGHFTDLHTYIKSVKILTCAAEPAGGSCLGNTYNGAFYQ